MWKRLKGISALLESYREKQMISNYRSRRKKFQAALVTTWGSEVKAKLASVDESVVVTGKRLNEIKKEASVEGGEKEDLSLQKKRKELLKFERAQLELKLEYKKKTAEVIKSQKEPSKADNATLPKLTITKFNGT